MLLAPLVAVLALLAVPVWPVAIAVISVLWLLIWPLERAARLVGLAAFRGWTARIGRALFIVAKPWAYLNDRDPTPPPAGVAPATTVTQVTRRDHTPPIGR